MPNLNIEIMNLDTHTDHNPDAPWNQEENEPEQDNNLEYKLKSQIIATKYHRDNLCKFAKIEETFRIFGFLTDKELDEKDNILNQYL